MAVRLKLLRSSTTGAVPATTSSADAGEAAVNLADLKVFVRDASGAMVEVANRVAAYSALREYASGDLAIQSDVIYRCDIPITVPESFNAAKWTALGATVGLDPAVILAPGTATRNRVTPAGDYPAFEARPTGGQSVNLIDINGTKHDARGLPIGRYGEAVFLVSQASHPFSAVGEPAAYVHPNWVQAQSGVAGKNVRAIVHEIIDANNVLLQMSGRVRSLAAGAFVGGSITAGAVYYLSTTLGKLTNTPPAVGAQPVLLALTATTGVLLLSNAAGAVIGVAPPGAAAQTVFSPLSISNAAGTQRLDINPQAQSISGAAGTPAVLTFGADGSLTASHTIFAAGLQIPKGTAGVRFGAAEDRIDLIAAAGGSPDTLRFVVDNAARLSVTATDVTASPGVVFNGSGAGLTALPAGSLTGTIADARLPSTMSGKTFSTAVTVSGLLTGTLFHAQNGGYFNIGAYSTSSYGTGSARLWFSADDKRLTMQSLIGGTPGPIALRTDEWTIAMDGRADFGTIQLGRTPAGGNANGYVSALTSYNLNMRSGATTVTLSDVSGNNLSSFTAATCNLTGNVRAATGYVWADGVVRTDSVLQTSGSVEVVGGTHLYLGSAGSGNNVYLRPNGRTSSTNQGVMLSNGTFQAPTIRGDLVAEDLTSGIIPMARFWTGASANDWVRSRMAGNSASEVGMYAFLMGPSGGHSANSNYSGSSLRTPYFQVNVNSNNLDIVYGSGPGGTWKAMGSKSAASDEACLDIFMRIS